MDQIRPRQENRDGVFLGFLFVLTLGFNLLHINKFYPISEGWFQDYADYILQGKIPYRDFYLFVPPIWPLMMTGISALSGNLFLAFRMYGVLERLAIVALAFVILRRSFRSDQVFIALIAASAVYISNFQDLFYGYYQTSILFILVMLWLSIRFCESNDEKKLTLYAILFGITGGITVLCKLPAGVIIYAILAFCSFFILWKKGKRALLLTGVSVISYMLALFVSLIPWIILGAFRPMIEQLLMGSSSKGSIMKILFGFIPELMNGQYVKYMLVVAAVLTLTIVFGRLYHNNKKGYEVHPCLSLLIGMVQNALLFLLIWPFALDAHFPMYFDGFSLNLKILVFVILGMTVICSIFLTKCSLTTSLSPRFQVAYWLSSVFLAFLLLTLLTYIVSHDFGYLDWSNERNASRNSFNYASFFFITVFVLITFVFLLKDRSEDRSIRLLIGAAAWGILYIHGMSNTIEDHAMLLPLSFIICLILDSRFVSLNIIKNAIVYQFCILLFVCIFVQRCYLPYHWWGVNAIDPVYQATSVYDDPKLAGLKGSEQATNAINEITHVIAETKEKGNTMVTFPHCSSFNVMTGLKNDLFAKTHFFDVCCDDVAIADAGRLKADPPTYLLWMDISEEAWIVHEELFRGGNPCGQRVLQEAYEELVSSGKYALLWEGNIGSSDPVLVWRLTE